MVGQPDIPPEEHDWHRDRGRIVDDRQIWYQKQPHLTVSLTKWLNNSILIFCSSAVCLTHRYKSVPWQGKPKNYPSKCQCLFLTQNFDNNVINLNSQNASAWQNLADFNTQTAVNNLHKLKTNLDQKMLHGKLALCLKASFQQTSRSWMWSFSV